MQESPKPHEQGIPAFAGMTIPTFYDCIIIEIMGNTTGLVTIEKVEILKYIHGEIFTNKRVIYDIRK